MPRTFDWFSRTLSVLCLSAAGACAPAEPESGANAPALADITIPQGFDFSTSQPLALRIESTQPEVGLLEVADQRGDLVYRGALWPERPLELAVSLAKADRTVRVSLELAGERSTVDVEIARGAAVHRF